MYMINDSTAIVLQEEVILQVLDRFSETSRQNPNNFFIFGLMDCSKQNLSRRAWNLMNFGMDGVALSCEKLQKLQISLTSKKMMQLFRIMEDRQAYLLISLGEEMNVMEELHKVVAECTHLKIVLWDTRTMVN